MNVDNIEVTKEEDKAFDLINNQVSEEWGSGDVGEVNGEKLLVISHHPLHPSIVVVETNDNEYLSVGVDMLKKPETPQHREDRERLENGKSLHNAASKTEEAISHGIFRLWEMEDKEVRRHYCQLAEIIGYRKDKPHGTN